MKAVDDLVHMTNTSRMRIGLLVFALGATVAGVGCSDDPPCGTRPVWSHRIERTGATDHDPMLPIAIAASSSGDVWVVVPESERDIVVGEHVLRTPALVRISSDGEIVASATLSPPATGIASIDEIDGDVVIAWKGSPAKLVRYDGTTLEPQWTVDAPGFVAYQIDIESRTSSASGDQIAYLASVPSTAQIEVRTLDPDGNARWTADVGTNALANSPVRIASNGDVFVRMVDRMRRLAHADGTVVGDFAPPGGSIFGVAERGGVTALTGVAYRGDPWSSNGDTMNGKGFTTLVAPDGSRRWTRVLDVAGDFGQPVLTPSGDVLVLLRIDHGPVTIDGFTLAGGAAYVGRFAAQTGELVGVNQPCEYGDGDIKLSTDDGYIAWRWSAVAKFALP